jgi:site-specific recombinase XerD
MRVVLAEWLRHVEARGRSPHTIDSYRRTVENVINPVLGEIPLNELTARDLDRFYDQLLAKPSAPPRCVVTMAYFHRL